MNVSFYSTNIKQLSGAQTLPILSVLQAIKNGDFQDQVIPVANEPDKAKRNELKKRVPYFTPSGEFEKREASGLVKHSGLIAMDFDSLENIKSVEIALKNDPYSFAVFRSISHKGLCVLVKIDPSRHLDSFKALELYYWKLLNVTVDQSCKDVSRARFVSFDPDLYVNQKSKRFGELHLLDLVQQTKKGDIAPLIPVTDYDHIFSNLLKWWDKKYGYVDGQRNSNLLVLAQSCNEYGIPQEYTKGMIQNNIISDDFPERELDSVIASAYRRTKSNIKQFENKTETKKVVRAIKSGAPVEQIASDLGIDEEQVLERIQSDEAKAQQSKKLDIRAVQLYIQKLGIRRNVITRMYEDKHGRELETNDLNSIFIEAKVQFEKLSREIFDTILYSNLTPDYNPLIEYLDALKWDGRDRLETLAQSITSTTGTPDFRERMVTKWLYGAVNAAYTYEPNVLNLIFAGQKNTGKTWFFRKLLPEPLQRYVASSQLDNGKDDLILLTQKWFVFDDEYSGKSKQDSKRMKMILSSADFSLREPYGRKNVTLKRLATLCGTCNELEILNDPTGNRRIIVIEATGKFNFELYNSVDKNQLFAQLVAMHKAGDFEQQLTNAEIQELETYTGTQYSEVNLEEELCREYFAVPMTQSQSEWMSTSMIKTYIESETNQRLNLRKLGMALRSIGFERKSKGSVWGYMVSKNGRQYDAPDNEWKESNESLPF